MSKTIIWANFIMDFASKHKHEYLTIEHALYAAFKTGDDEFDDIVEECGIDADRCIEELEEHLSNYDGQLRSGKPSETMGMGRVVLRSISNAKLTGVSDPATSDVLYACATETESYAQKLLELFTTPDQISEAIVVIREENRERFDGPINVGDGTAGEGKVNKALAKYCTNLNIAVEEGQIDPLIGREDEIEQITKTLSRRKKNNVILVGDEGVGKTAIAEGLAYLIVNERVSHKLANATVYNLDVGAMLAGAKYRGDFEERLKQVIAGLSDLAKAGKEPILFIDEIHTINGAGSNGQGSLDMANMLKPALASGMKCIGSTTSDEYRKTFEKDKALARRFRNVMIKEPSIDDTKLILAGIASAFEEFHFVTYPVESLAAAVELSAKFIHNKHLPDKAIDIIDSVAAGYRMHHQVEDGDEPMEITVDMIEQEVASIAKISQKSMSKNEASDIAELESRIKAVVFGQDSAVEELTESYMMSRAGLREPTKPIGSYLFAGPTGVGKTEVAKSLAEELNVPLVKFDMSEYMEKHSVAKLIGSPPGYVGYEEEGLLIKAIEDNPSSVLLLDEIEKASPDVLNILLQIMDAGTLTSSKGKAISFRNVILIMTSNAGAADASRNTIGFGNDLSDSRQTDAIEKMFAPEFRNRLDAIVMFDKLGKDIIGLIVDKFILRLNNMASERNVFVEITDACKAKLIEDGFDEKMGARPMERAIQEHIKKPLAKAMLFGDLINGGVATVDIKDGEYVIGYETTKLVENAVAEPV